jgi:hypothetical protein
MDGVGLLIVVIVVVWIFLVIINRKDESERKREGLKLGTHIKLENGKIVNEYYITGDEITETKEYKFLKQHNKLNYIEGDRFKYYGGGWESYHQVKLGYERLKNEIANNIKERKEAEEQRMALIKSKKEILRLASRKPEWQQYERILDANKIGKLYHFTDKSNLRSIKKHGALYSWYYCENNKIDIPKPGGSSYSRKLDQRHGTENYVRVSFTRDHPMMYVIGGNNIVLEIDREVIYTKGTQYANMNAVKNGVNIGATLADFKKIKFKIVTQPDHFNLSADDKPFYQGEVLVLEKIPAEYILNLDDH